MSKLPSGLSEAWDWVTSIHAPWLSLGALFAALGYALFSGFTAGRVFLIGLCAVVAGFRYLRIARGSLANARAIAAYDATRRKPIPRHEIPLRVRNSLVANELVYVQTRLHPIVTIKWWLLSALSLVLVPAAAVHFGHVWILLALVPILGLTTFKIVDWFRSRLYVTKYRILFLHGVFSMSLAETPITKVTDKDTEERLFPTTLARLRIIWLPYGRLGIETAGQIQWISDLKHIPNVMMVGMIISQQAVGSETTEDEAPPKPRRHDRQNRPI